MQIRLTVLGPRESGGASGTSLAHASAQPTPLADVLVSAPVGTTLGAVAAALAGAVGVRSGGRSARTATHVHFYVRGRRLEEQSLLGHPPLVDGAVLRLDSPDPEDAAEPAGSAAALHVVGGPDAGGIHLLHPGRVLVGRSADADVPVDDPDVSRFHLALEVGSDGLVSVADTDSTNGTSLDGAPLGAEPRRVPPGGLIELGESALRLVPPQLGRVEVVPDGRGAIQVSPALVPLSNGSRGPAGRTASGTGSLPEAAPLPAQPTHGRGFRLGGLGLRRGGPAPGERPAQVPPQALPRESGRWPDPAEVLLTALGPGPRLWERGPDHEDALVVRLGTRAHAPVTVDLRAVGSLGLTGPRARLSGLARGLLAQLAVAHAPSTLELVLLAADESRPLDERADTWSWLLWLPHLRPTHGQPCRALAAFDATQAFARLAELAPGWGEAAPTEGTPPQRSGTDLGPGTNGPAGSAPGGFDPRVGTANAERSRPGSMTRGRHTVVLVDGDPGSDAARAAVAELAAHGAARGVHLIQLAEHPEELSPAIGAIAAITGEVGTLLDVERPRPGSPGPWGSAAGQHAPGQHRAAPERELLAGVALDAVGAAWAGRLARALAPLREPETVRRSAGRSALPESSRLLDLLGLDLVTPVKISARWADLRLASGEIPVATVGVGRDGACALDLTDHLLIGGAPQSGRTELLRSLLAALAVAERPDRLGLLLIEGRPPQDAAQGLSPAVELPHVVGHVATTDGPALREAAQALSAELDRRSALLQGRSFAAWHAERALSRLTPPRRAADDYPQGAPSGALAVDPEPLPHLVVAVDDWDALVGSPLAHVLEDTALRGPRLGVRLAVTTGRPEYTAGTAVDEAAQLRVSLRSESPTASALLIHVDDAAALSPDQPGRGLLRHADGGVTPFQMARVTGRIPRTATLRPTVTPLDWTTLGEPPASRPVRELGNGPTDLALLASALNRAAESQATPPVPPLL